RIIEVVAPEMARVKMASGGSEANESAVRLARAYHVDRGRPERWRIISPAQAYHGSTLGTLALSGRRRSLQDPYVEYMPGYLHIPPSTSRLDPNGEQGLKELERVLKEDGQDTASALFCGTVSAGARVAYRPPARCGLWLDQESN